MNKKITAFINTASMKYIPAILFLLLFNTLHAQTGKQLNEHLSLSFGMSKHGSGDLPGIMLSTEYARNFKKRLSYSIAISATIHDEEDTLFLRPYPGAVINSSIRGTTAGIQIAGYLGYDILKGLSNNLKFKAGPLLRYQSSSSSGYTILYPALTSFPTPLLYLDNYEPQRVFTIGASVQLRYDYTLTNRITFGLLAGFQMDSNGDNISQTSLSIGRRF